MLIRGGRYAAPAQLTKGWNSSYNAGTTGDYYVGNVTGNDANPGTFGSPFQTFGAAIAAAIAAGSQKSIKVFDQGTHYRDTITTAGWNGTSGAKCSITGYGTQKPVIRGDNVYTGWTQCDGGDSTLLGGTLGTGGSPVYKKTGITRTDIVGDNLYGMCVTEADALVALVQDASSIPNKHVTGNTTAFYTGTVTKDGSNKVIAITHVAVGAYTTAQLAGAIVAWHGGANEVYYSPITSSSGNTVNFTAIPGLAPAGQPASGSSATTTGFALLNVLPALTAGRFGYVDNGATVDVYIYPTDSANLAGGNVGIVKRKRLIDLSASDYIKVEGFDLMNMGGGGNNDATHDGCPLAIGMDTGIANVGKQVGHEVRHVRIRNQAAGNAIFSKTAQDLTLEYITIKDIYMRCENLCRCIGLQYITVGQWSYGARLRYLDIRDVEQNAVQFYGQRDAVFAYSYVENSGQGAHVDIFNAYLNSDNVLYWGIEVVNAGGYATWQLSSGITLGMCMIDHVLADGNAIRDQQNGAGTPPPTVPATYLVINNTTRSSILLGHSEVHERTVTAYNNICAGITQTAVPPATTTITTGYNVFLDSTTDVYGLEAFDNQIASSSVFDGSTMDLSLTSTVISLGGKNLETTLLALEAQYGENLHYDVRGYAFPTLDFTGALRAARGLPDLTVPTLSSPTASAGSSEVLVIGVTTAEARGGVWYVVTTSSTAPTAAQVAAGQNHLGATAVASGILTNVSAGAKSTAVSGLTPSTTYYAYFTHEDMHGNRSAVSSANATTEAQLTGVRLIAQSGAYSTFTNGPVTQAIPAMLEGDCMVVLAEIIYNSTTQVYSTQNPIQSGYTYDGSAWDGTKLPPSTTPNTGKPATYVWHRVAGVGGVAAHTFSIPISSAGNVAVTYLHFRGDSALTFVGYDANVSSTYPATSLNNGDTAVSLYNNVGTNSGASVPVLAANATAFSVVGGDYLPQNTGVWINAYSASSVPKNMALVKVATSTGVYTSPTTADTTTFSAFVFGLR